MNRQRFVPAQDTEMPRWQESLFIILSNNAVAATEFFRLPPNRVVELGGQTEI
jgi:KUP system potassium uptake protein